MRLIKLVGPAAILLGGFVLCATSVYGTADYAKKEKQGCATCHAKMVADKAEMNKNLTATGTCYKDNDHSLAKCAPPKK